MIETAVENKQYFQEILNKKLIQENIIKQNGEVFPVSLSPYFIEKSCYEKVALDCELVLSAVEKLIKAYQENPELQAYFSEFDKYRYITLMQPAYQKWIQLARFDLALDPNGKFYLMETNTACPGGAVIVPKIKKLFEQLESSKNLETLQIMKQNMDDETYFIKQIIETYKTVKGKEPEHIGYAYSQFRSIKSDMSQLTEITNQLGYSAEAIHAQDLTIKNGKAYVSNRPFDLIHHKFDIMTEDNGQQRPCLFEHTQEECKDYLRSVKENLFVPVNPFPSMTISESKKILPLLLDEKFHFLFSKNEIEAIKNLCPPTHTLKTGDKNEDEIYKNILNSKNNYVLKYAFDTRSRGVFIGSQLSQEDWKKVLETSKYIPSIAQKYIEHKVEKILSPIDESILSCRTNIAVYLIKGKAGGVLCRSSTGYKSNFYADGIYRPAYIFQGS